MDKCPALSAHCIALQMGMLLSAIYFEKLEAWASDDPPEDVCLKELQRSLLVHGARAKAVFGDLPEPEKHMECNPFDSDMLDYIGTRTAFGGLYLGRYFAEDKMRESFRETLGFE